MRAAVRTPLDLVPRLRLIAGGKSFGGRMTSQAQAQAPLPGSAASSFVGFPLHPAGRASSERGRHLTDVHVPMLFLQGTRDQLALPDQIEPLCKALGQRATLHLLEGADHSFHVLARSGRSDAQVRQEMLAALVSWVGEVAAAC